MFETKFVYKIKTHIFYSITFFRKPCRLWDKVEKYCTTRQDTDDNMANAHCMLYTSGWRHELRISNTYSFATATMIARTFFIVRCICTLLVLLTTFTDHLTCVQTLVLVLRIFLANAEDFASQASKAIHASPGCNTQKVYIYIYIYRVSQEECARLREGVPYVKVYRYNPKTPMSKVERLRR